MGKERVHFAYISIVTSIREGSQGQELKKDRNTEAGVDAEAMKEYYLLHMACSACFFIETSTTSIGLAGPAQWAGPFPSITK